MSTALDLGTLVFFTSTLEPTLQHPCPAQITEEQRLKAEIEHQEEKLRQKIAEQRVQMGGINNSAEQSIKVRRWSVQLRCGAEVSNQRC